MCGTHLHYCTLVAQESVQLSATNKHCAVYLENAMAILPPPHFLEAHLFKLRVLPAAHWQFMYKLPHAQGHEVTHYRPQSVRRLHVFEFTKSQLPWLPCFLTQFPTTVAKDPPTPARQSMEYCQVAQFDPKRGAPLQSRLEEVASGLGLKDWLKARQPSFLKTIVAGILEQSPWTMSMSVTNLKDAIFKDSSKD